jgi:hypothetical protein
MQKSEKYFMEIWIENPFPPKFAGEIVREVLKAAPHHCNYQLSGSKCSVLLVLDGAGSCKPVESSRSVEAETTPTLKKGELYEQLL